MGWMGEPPLGVLVRPLSISTVSDWASVPRDGNSGLGHWITTSGSPGVFALRQTNSQQTASRWLYSQILATRHSGKRGAFFVLVPFFVSRLRGVRDTLKVIK